MGTLDVPTAQSDPYEAIFVDIESDIGRWAFMVDKILGQRQVVVKSVGLTPSHIWPIAGGAVMGDGRVGLLLDIPALTRNASHNTAQTGNAA